MTDGHPQAAHGGRLAGLDHPLRNRVSPAGELIATTHRGTMYGNRGVLHNEDLALVRRYQVRRWLVCVLEFRGRRRPMMRPGRFTELFFLDEAVALAAGHRPCAECRHAAYQSFRTAWAAALALPARPGAAPGAPPGGRRPRYLPRATVAAIRAGYHPLLHPSASGTCAEEETGGALG